MSRAAPAVDRRLAGGRHAALSLVLLYGILCTSCSGPPVPPAVELRNVSANSGSVGGELFVDGTFVAHTLQTIGADQMPTAIRVPPGTYSATLAHRDEGGWSISLDGPAAGESGQSIRMITGSSLNDGVLTLGDIVKNREDRIRTRKPKTLTGALTRAFYGDEPPSDLPSREITLSIVEPPGPTVFSSERLSFRYQGGGHWTATTASNNGYVEDYRDTSYVVLKNATTRRIFGLPLFGGRLASKRDGASGGWLIRGSAPNLARNQP